jgi:hypothetical protein
MQQLRIYTLADKKTAEHYCTIHWTKHLTSLPKFGVEIKGVWMGNSSETENQVIAIISFSEDADISEVTDRYMKSSEFADDMAGFDKSSIINVETRLMKSANLV